MGVYGLSSPRIPIFSPYKYHGAPLLGVHLSLSLEAYDLPIQNDLPTCTELMSSKLRTTKVTTAPAVKFKEAWVSPGEVVGVAEKIQATRSIKLRDVMVFEVVDI